MTYNSYISLEFVTKTDILKFAIISLQKKSWLNQELVCIFDYCLRKKNVLISTIASDWK